MNTQFKSGATSYYYDKKSFIEKNDLISFLTYLWKSDYTRVFIIGLNSGDFGCSVLIMLEKLPFIVFSTINWKIERKNINHRYSIYPLLVWVVMSSTCIYVCITVCARVGWKCMIREPLSGLKRKTKWSLKLWLTILS